MSDNRIDSSRITEAPWTTTTNAQIAIDSLSSHEEHSPATTRHIPRAMNHLSTIDSASDRSSNSSDTSLSDSSTSSTSSTPSRPETDDTKESKK
ncbi:MAG TPA: hypothetical protein VJK54_01775 [Chthoniobacterales bacterium]|nr:hypothetical protein [Chthoniobacterales bacterium]